MIDRSSGLHLVRCPWYLLFITIEVAQDAKVSIFGPFSLVEKPAKEPGVNNSRCYCPWMYSTWTAIQTTSSSWERFERCGQL